MRGRWYKTLKCSVPPKKKEGQEIIQDNENTFGFRGQTVFIIFHDHSWLTFNAGPCCFNGQKVPGVKAVKGIVPPGFGMVTIAHWCILCFYSYFLEVLKRCTV